MLQRLLLMPLLLFTQISLSQQENESPDYCDWHKVLQTTENHSEKLDLIKEHFISIDNFYFNGVTNKCKVLYTISVNDLYLVLSTTSAQAVRDPKAIVNTIKSSEIETVHVYDQKIAENLYSTYGLVHFTSKSDNLKRRIDRIRIGKK